jgi:hypothetical protein
MIIGSALLVFFLLPDTKVGGEEVVWLFGQAVPVDSWRLPLPGFQMNLQSIAGLLAMLYVIIGLAQTLPFPKEIRYRGTWIANLLTSGYVLGVMLWTWYRLIWDAGYHLTSFQHQVFGYFLIASVLDTAMFDIIVPALRKFGGRVATPPKPLGP